MLPRRESYEVDSSPIKNEKSAGWIFHYLTGGSVALIYPVLYLASKVSVPEGHLIASLLLFQTVSVKYRSL